MPPDQRPPGADPPAEESVPTLPPVMSGPPQPSVPTPPVAVSDGDLLAAVRGGDEQALWALLERHRAYLRHVAARVLVARPEDCDGEVNEAFLRARAGVAGFRGTTAQEFLVWLARITRNLI